MPDDHQFFKRLLLFEGPVKSGFLREHIIWNINDVLTYGGILERRARVETLPKIGTIQVYADHDPPHFHVRIKDSTDLKFHVNSCIQIDGSPISAKQKKDLLYWYNEEYGYDKVVALWNQMNPGREIIKR